MRETRATQKNRLQQQQAGAGGGDPSFVCGVCERDCHSRIGLVSHSCTHRTTATYLVILLTEGQRRRRRLTVILVTAAASLREHVVRQLEPDLDSCSRDASKYKISCITFCSYFVISKKYHTTCASIMLILLALNHT